MLNKNYELQHSFTFFERELKVIRHAVCEAKHYLNQELSNTAQAAIAPTYDGGGQRGLRCVFTDSDLIVIANGMIILEPTPLYQWLPIIHRKADNQNEVFNGLHHTISKHLGRTFLN